MSPSWRNLGSSGADAVGVLLIVFGLRGAVSQWGDLIGLVCGFAEARDLGPGLVTSVRRDVS